MTFDTDKYAKEKMERLEKFERRVRDTIEGLSTALHWVWIILGIVSPVFLWFRPVPENGGVQSVMVAVIFWILFCIAMGLKAIAKLRD